MDKPSTIIDPFSEMLAVSTSGNIKNIILAFLHMKGDLDLELYRRALEDIPRVMPELTSVLKEIRHAGRYYLVREHRPDMAIPLCLTELGHHNSDIGLQNRLAEAVQPSLDRWWDLFNEPPIRMHLIRVNAERYVLACLMHHVAGDVSQITTFGKHLFSRYHALIAGKPPHWSQEVLSVSSSRKRRVSVREEKLKDKWANALQTARGLLKRPVLPKGTGDPNDVRQFHCKRVLSEEDTRRASLASLRGGVALLDNLTASAHRSVDEWNDVRGMDRGEVTSSMTVNMRGRYDDLAGPNKSAVILFKTTPQERGDRTTFTRKISSTRMKYFREQHDRRFYANMQRMNDGVRMFPLPIRRKMVDALLSRNQVSIAITLLGVMWPVVKDGKPTGDSFLTGFGDQEFEELDGIGYKLISTTRLLLIVYVFRKRLNLLLTSAACHFTRAESEEFLDLLTDLFLAEGSS